MTIADPASTVAAILERRIDECGRQLRRLDLTASERRTWAIRRNTFRARLWQIENPEAHAEHQRAYRARQRGVVVERVDRRCREHREARPPAPAPVQDRRAARQARLLSEGLCPECEATLTARGSCFQCGREWSREVRT